MKRRYAVTAIVIFSVLSTNVQANVVAKGVREIIEAIWKRSVKKATQELAEFGGQKAVQETLEKAAREGGDELVEKVVRYRKQYGIAAVRVIDSTPSHYVKALDGLPDDLIERAIWAAQREPEMITALVRNHGSDALVIAARHRGVGTNLIGKLGDDGIRLGKALPETQAVTIARHADELSSLPPSQKAQVIDAILAAPARVIDYIEKHPNVFQTAACITTVIALKDDVLGKDEEIVVGPDGATIIRKKGFVERLFDQFRTSLVAILAVIAFIVGGWGLVKIWGTYRMETVRIALKDHELRQQREGNIRPCKNEKGNA